jgi:hypothetical protein
LPSRLLQLGFHHRDVLAGINALELVHIVERDRPNVAFTGETDLASTMGGHTSNFARAGNWCARDRIWMRSLSVHKQSWSRSGSPELCAERLGPLLRLNGSDVDAARLMAREDARKARTLARRDRHVMRDRYEGETKLGLTVIVHVPALEAR